MSPIVRQVGFLLSFYVFIVASRIWARERWLRKMHVERERRAALEREWRVGIPYDPGSEERV